MKVEVNTDSASHVDDENIKLTNATPEAISNIFTSLVTLLENYGWFVLIGVVLIVYLYHKYEPVYRKWNQKRQDAAEDTILKKDPDKAYQIQLSLEQSRLRLQQKVNEDARKKKIAQEIKDEEKRLKKIQEWDNHVQGKGYHSKYKLEDSKKENTGTGYIKPKKSLRPSDYNPLAGPGGSSGYRPSARRNVSGGG